MPKWIIVGRSPWNPDRKVWLVDGVPAAALGRVTDNLEKVLNGYIKEFCPGVDPWKFEAVWDLEEKLNAAREERGIQSVDAASD